MKKILLLLFLIFTPLSLTATTPSLKHTLPRNTLKERDSLINAIMTSSKTEVKVDENITFAITIINSWYWEVKNVSFSLLLPLTQDFNMIDQKIIGEGNSSTNTIEESVNLSVTITSGVKRNSTTKFYVTGKFKDTGEFSIEVSQVKLVKRRGDIIVQESIQCEGLTISVEEKEESPRLPSQGNKRLEEVIFIVLVALPIVFLSLLTYIEKKPL